jgi:hypothetical protein
MVPTQAYPKYWSSRRNLDQKLGLLRRRLATAARLFTQNKVIGSRWARP